jgi:DNA-binding MarR family transcriptional regulator
MSSDHRKRNLHELSRALRGFLSASDSFDETLGKVLGLNPTDVRCVDLLDQFGTMTAGALAEVAGLSTGAVTFVLDRLERAGFVRRVRDENDRRRVLVELDAAARVRVSELHEGLAQAWRASADRFSVADLRSIIEFLEEGAKLYQAQVPVLCAQVPSGADPQVADGRAALKAALKAQAKAEAFKQLEKTARKLRAKADELHSKAAEGPIKH